MAGQTPRLLTILTDRRGCSRNCSSDCRDSNQSNLGIRGASDWRLPGVRGLATPLVFHPSSNYSRSPKDNHQRQQSFFGSIPAPSLLYLPIFLSSIPSKWPRSSTYVPNSPLISFHGQGTRSPAQCITIPPRCCSLSHPPTRQLTEL